MDKITFFKLLAVVALTLLVLVELIKKSIKTKLEYPEENISDLKTGTNILICAKENGQIITQVYEDFQTEVNTGEVQKKFILKGIIFLGCKVNTVYEVKRLSRIYYLKEVNPKAETTPKVTPKPEVEVYLEEKIQVTSTLGYQESLKKQQQLIAKPLIPRSV